MRQIILICSLFFTFTLHIRINAQNSWEENFNTPEKGYWADESGNLQSDFSGVEWSLDVSGSHFSSLGDYAKTITTSGGRFEVLDSDGDVIWSSPVMDISNYTTVSASIKAGETGSNTGASKKFVKAAYLLDGKLFPFSPDSIVSGNWGDKFMRVEGIYGNQLQLVVTMNSSYASDKVFLDNILVEGIDSTLFEPQRIALISLPSYSFIGEETQISASVFDKRDSVITDKQFGLTFQSTDIEVVSESFFNGIYSWLVKPDSAGKVFFNIQYEDTLVEGIDAFLQVYSRENLVMAEDFESGNASGWRNGNDWEVSPVNPISGNFSLKHMVQSENENSSIIYDVFNLNLSDGNYHFSFKMKNGNWDPSSSNSFYFVIAKWGITDYLADGYVVGVNAMGSSDRVSLWTIKEGKITDLVAETSFDWGESDLVKFDLSRNVFGEWKLTATDLATGLIYLGSGFNNEFELINCFGINFYYTQSRSGQLWFDDLLVLRENAPPSVKWIKTLYDGRIQICFNEDVKIDLLTKENFKIESRNGKNYQIDLLESKGKDTIIIETAAIDEVDLLLTAFNVEDLEGAVADSVEFAFEYQMPVAQHDIVITEIMADPTPVVGLPEAEYIEIFNRSDKIIIIENWRLTIRDQISVLPTCIINPGEYFIVSNSRDSALFLTFGNVIAVNNFPSLLNAGITITISTQEGLVIDSVTYSDNWYKDSEKKNGGWSLEKIDPGRFCGDRNNWTVSIDVSGGTPGKINSVDASNLDNLPPELLEVNLISATTIELLFSETFIPPDIENITVDNGLKTDSLYYDLKENRVTIICENELEGNEQYQLSISELSDECGNISQNISITISRQVIGVGDMVINEVLFNPFTDGADFVELYNQSGISVDLSKLKLATRNDTLALKSVYPLADNKIELPNQSYMVFTRDSENIVNHYWVPNPDRIFQMENFPAFPDDEGYVVLLNDSLEVIDEFAYNEGMHSKWLSDLNGVSLERLSFTGETNDPENWHSASSLVGFATPGYENSQPEAENPVGVSIKINHDAISPNNDGFNDEMEIEFHLDKTGYLANVFVFDINGRRVNRLLNNDLIGNSDKIIFDGIDESGRLLPMGIYILLTELVHPDGEKKVFKQSFLVTDKR